MTGSQVFNEAVSITWIIWLQRSLSRIKSK